jgi:hypothetical protein
MISSILSFATAVTLGLLAGSLLLEGAVLVPFWQKLTPKEFFVLHPAFGRRLFYYFAPLTLLAALVPALSALWLMGGSAGANVAAIASLLVLSFFPLYFRKANEAFSNRIVSDEELTGRLSEWAKVHAIRTVIAIVSFGAAVIAIARP